MHRLFFRILWAVLSCVTVVAMLSAVKPYLPVPSPTEEFTPIITEPEAPPPPEEPEKEPELPDNPVDFAALQAEFPEAVAWIRIPDVGIDYAVMQSGENTKEDYYLDRNESGKKDRNGSIYMQKYNLADFSDPNTILYGHNMRGYKMFGAVHKFKKADFFKENEYLYIYIPGHVLKYQIYSVFTFGTSHLLWTYDFTTEEGRQDFIDKTLKPRTSVKQVREGVTPTPDDKFVTLSTCMDASANTNRLLLVAMLVDDIATK